MRKGILLAAVAAGLLTVGCGAKTNYVKVDNVALGRVVVYRNGVAFYERRAKITGHDLTVRVPREKVDDFLKSLTVVDATTGKTLPVSFPRRRGEADGIVEMTIQLPTTADVTDLKLTYVTEAPAWKPSYRIRVAPDGTVMFEGWAIVDNTSGEDWNKVKVGVGSSSALSFRYDLWSVRSVHRERLANRDRFAVAPPRGVSPYKEQTRGAGKAKRVMARLGDDDIPRGNGHPSQYDADVGKETVVATAAQPAPPLAARGGYGRRTRGYKRPARQTARKKAREHARRRRLRQRQQRQQRAARRVVQLAKRIRAGNHRVVIEGYSVASERSPRAKAADRANSLRNKLIDAGVSPGLLVVRNRGVVRGERAGVKLVVEDSASPKKDARKGQAHALERPVGESHFESSTPMTVARDTSVMVSIVKKKTRGEVVYFYDPETSRGNRRYAFRSVRFQNPTSSTLENGPVTVYGKNRFVGEGMTDAIPPNATAIVPFALDRQIIVEPIVTKRDHIAKLVTIQRGVVTAKIQHVRRTRFKVTSRRYKRAKVFVRHAAQAGWTLTKHPKKGERVGGAWIFQVDVGPGETKYVDIEESTPIVRTLDMRSPAGLKMVGFYLTASPDDPEFAGQIRALLKLNTELVDTRLTIDSVRVRLRDYRVRMDELHAQLVSLKAVKTKGPLMKHLQLKLKQISDRVQKATIQLVDLEQSALIARIRFQDGVADLSLASKVAKK